MSNFSPNFVIPKDKEDKNMSDYYYDSDFEPSKKKDENKSILSLEPEKKKAKYISALEP